MTSVLIKGTYDYFDELMTEHSEDISVIITKMYENHAIATVIGPFDDVWEGHYVKLYVDDDGILTCKLDSQLETLN